MPKPIDKFGSLPKDELLVIAQRCISSLLTVVLTCLNPAIVGTKRRAWMKAELQGIAADLQKAIERIAA